MFRRTSLFIFALYAWNAVTYLAAQSPAKPSPTPSLTPSPQASSTPTTRALIDSMDSADLKEAIQLLKNNYIKPDALNETELSRAAFEGILTRLGRGVILLSDSGAEPAEPAMPFLRRGSGGAHCLSPARRAQPGEPRRARCEPANFRGEESGRGRARFPGEPGDK